MYVMNVLMSAGWAILLSTNSIYLCDNEEYMISIFFWCQEILVVLLNLEVYLGLFLDFTHV